MVNIYFIALLILLVAFETQILLLILHILIYFSLSLMFPIVYLPNLVRSVEVTVSVVGCEKIFDITGKFDEEN